nr:MAG TPA: hypothetical protein [Caudoviricetes sp.]
MQYYRVKPEYLLDLADRLDGIKAAHPALDFSLNRC